MQVSRSLSGNSSLLSVRKEERVVVTFVLTNTQLNLAMIIVITVTKDLYSQIYQCF